MCTLGLALGKTLAELARLPESELQIWQAFYAEQPFGHWREDWRMATLASTVANTVASKPFQAQDFMPFHHQQDPDADLMDGAIVV